MRHRARVLGGVLENLLANACVRRRREVTLQCLLRRRFRVVCTCVLHAWSAHGAARARHVRIIAACQHLVWLRVVGWAFGGWVQQGKARADRLEEVKRLLLSSHGAGGKQCALRWVIMARKMCDVGRYVLRRAHLAGKLSRMARTAVLGRHWVETMYSILGLEKGHLFAHGRTVIDVNESRHRALGVRAHAELHWVLLFCVALQRTSLALFDNLLSSSTLSVAWRSRQ